MKPMTPKEAEEYVAKEREKIRKQVKENLERETRATIQRQGGIKLEYISEPKYPKIHQGSGSPTTIIFPKHPRAYATLGHELAHLKLKHVKGEDSVAILTQEIEAWNEALPKFSKKDLPGAIKLAKQALLSYFRSVKREYKPDSPQYERGTQLYKEFIETWKAT